jgi:nanoRNase/pAp phosphatase (c-di-AMP/oligoRNAs hydrolase)
MNEQDLLKVNEIVSHANCPDGIGAAMIIKAAYLMSGFDSPPVQFVQYGTKKHEELKAKSGQLFVDITPPKERWEEWKGLSPIVLDHHESVMHIVHSLNGVYGDSDHSGAMLAFENVMAPLVKDSEDLSDWKEFAYLCMIRDTWKSSSPFWEKATSLAHALILYGQNWAMEKISETSEPPLPELLELGDKLKDKIIRQAKSILYNTEKTILKLSQDDADMIFVNHADGGSFSDLAHHLMDLSSCSAVVGYFYSYDGNKFNLVCSVRTNGVFSASELARSFGGGGHPRAAGFKLDGSLSPLEAKYQICSRIQQLNSSKELL